MILFKVVRWKNLLSTGNIFTEVKLNESASTLIVGENGAGKSTFIEAISFALYGKPFRKINKPQLLNSINGKNLLVEIEFSIGKKEYLVRRGIKPNIFEIFVDGSLLNQEANSGDYQDVLEKNVLKLSHKSFSQIITLGASTFVPFMQLPAQARRNFIEDLLDIQIFSTMNNLLKTRIQDNKDALKDANTQLALCEQKIELNKKHIESLRQNNNELIALKQSKINQHITMIDVALDEIEKFSTKIEEFKISIGDEQSITDRLNKVTTLHSELKFKLTDHNKHIKFLHTHDHCPTCTQDINPTFKEENLNTKIASAEELDSALTKLSEEQAKINARMKEIVDIDNQISDYNAEITDRNNKIRMYQKYNSELQKEIGSLRNNQTKVETDAVDLNKAKKELKDVHTLIEELTENRSLLGTAAVLLKDGGIKTKIVKQYVPVMNKLINKYLAAMDFFVQFELDENFDEKIKSRFRDEFSYASFSEGEKMKINLSLLFTWRAVAKLRNSASTNLLIFDETLDSSLDNNGIEEFIKIITDLSMENNVFIISHRGDNLQDKFSNIIKFEKSKNFSVITNI
jgi:DNA repair exonuclease SbcCD ATPase subunit